MQNNHILQSLVQSNTFKYYRVLVGRGNLYFSSPVIARQDRDDVDLNAGLRETPVLTRGNLNRRGARKRRDLRCLYCTDV